MVVPILRSATFCEKISWQTLYERRFGQPFKGPVIQFGAMGLNIFRFLQKEQSRPHQFGNTILLGIPLGNVLIAGDNLRRETF